MASKSPSISAACHALRCFECGAWLNLRYCLFSRGAYFSLQAQDLCKFVVFHPEWHHHHQFLFGIALVLTGATINLHADATLRHLRSLSQNRRQIPTGGLFEWVSAPHYFGEMVEWTGFCIACNFSLASVAFAAYTAANLIPRGIAHHKWYKTNFPTYPLNRKAVVPFIL